MTARCRIYTRQGAVYITERPAKEIADAVFGAQAGDTLKVETVVGQEALPAEWLEIRTDEIYAVQAMSEESWALQNQIEADHYRRLLAVTPQEQIAEAQQALARHLGSEDE